MLETIDEYASERLKESGELDAIARQHTDYFLELTERAQPHLAGTDQVYWLDRLERDHDNLRASLRWALDHNQVEIAARMAGALQTFWMARAHLREGIGWLQEVLSSPIRYSASARANALIGAGAFARQQGDLKSAGEYLQESLRISRDAGDLKGISMALINLGAVRGEVGDIAGAEPLFEEALAILRNLGEHRLMGMVLTNLGVTAEARGESQLAANLYEESLEISRKLGDGAGASLTLSNLGHISYDSGDYSTAAARFRESLVLARDSGHTYTPVHELSNLALISAALNCPDRAARLFAAAESHLEAVGAKQVDIDRDKYEMALERARSQISSREWQLAWSEGSRMSLGEAIHYGLEFDPYLNLNSGG
jgi:tetratricopeptide (TPR) repeat protein